LRLTGSADLEGRYGEAYERGQEPGQPTQEQTQAVTSSGKDEVGSVTCNAEQGVAADAAVALHVADVGLDGVVA
jgi:hypothetical protein